MQAHGPKRIYNPHSLEFWFGKLIVNWEAHFSDSVLRLGREWYREGLIREVELDIGQGIVHTKIEGRACYSVIEWADSVIKVRASVDDSDVGRAIAVAGMYEIEELVVDEIAPLEEDTLSRGSNALKPAPSVEIRQTQRPARPLRLRFDATRENLKFQAFWREDSGDSRVHLNGNGNGTGNGNGNGNGNGSHHLIDTEREKLIRLASLARKAQFHFDKNENAYALRELARVPAFLTQDLPLWRRYFEVEISPVAQKMFEGVRQVEVSIEAKGARGKRSGEGLNLKWIFRSGERLLDDDEADRLLRGPGGPVFLPDAGLVELTGDALETVKAWRPKGGDAGNGSRERYLLFSLFNLENRIGIRLSPEIEKWRKSFQGKPRPIKDLPEVIRPYQKKGVAWLAHLCEHGCHALLADEMGLGKTLQVISLLANRPTEEDRHLVVGPASVVPVWENEWERFFPETPVHVLRADNNFVSNPAPGVWLASYNQLRRHVDLLEKTRFGYAVLDEGQWIKNPDSKIARACCAIQARHRMVLTGTPLENRELDLWSLFRYLMPGLLGGRAEFEQSTQHNGDGRLERLRAQIAPFVMRRTKRVVAKELPPKVETTLRAPLNPVQREEYVRICSEGIRRLSASDGAKSGVGEHSFTIFSLLTRLRQACCDPDLLPWMSTPLEESGKISLLMEKLPEILAAGHKVVIFSQFVRLLDRIDRALQISFPDIPRFALNGGTRHRGEPVRAFQNQEGAAAILVSLRAGGTGITLHAADYVFLLDPWWNPAVEEQAIDRVHRIGQANTVFVYRILTAGTIEERIQDLQWSKQDIFRNLIGRINSGGSLQDNISTLCKMIELDTNKEGE